MKNLTTGVRTEDTKTSGKRGYPKSGQGDGSMTRSAAGVSKATGEPGFDFIKGGPTGKTLNYAKKGQDGTPGAFKDSVAASPMSRNNARKLT